VDFWRWGLNNYNFDSFKTRLTEHFGQGYIMADECVLDDMQTVEKL
jgi:hypothetical protein